MAGFGGGLIGLANVYPGMVESEQKAAQADINRLRMEAQAARLQQAQMLMPYRQALMQRRLAGGGGRGGALDASLPPLLQQQGQTAPAGYGQQPQPATPIPPNGMAAYGMQAPAGAWPPPGTPSPFPGPSPGQMSFPPTDFSTPAGFAASNFAAPSNFPAPGPSLGQLSTPPTDFSAPATGLLSAPASASGMPPGDVGAASPPAAPVAPQTSAGGDTFESDALPPSEAAPAPNPKIAELQAKIDTITNKLDYERISPRQRTAFEHERSDAEKRLSNLQKAETAKSHTRELETMATGIEKGQLDPEKLPYKDRVALSAILTRRGVNVTELTREFNIAKQQARTLQSPRILQLTAAIKAMPGTMAEVKRLAREMRLSGVPLINRIELLAKTRFNVNSPEGQLAQRYVTAVNTLREEFGQVINNNYAPTKPVWDQVNRQINQDYGTEQMVASLDEILKLMEIRYNNIPNIRTLGPQAPNRYIPSEWSSTGQYNPGGTGQADFNPAAAPTAPTQSVSAPSASPASEQPPMPGARKAPDGNWYIQQGDKYYKVTQ